MEQASLRPVPLRPPGPVDPAEAAAHVLSALPGLDETAARALALVEIAGRSRDQVAGEAEFTLESLGAALARARKELRRSIFPLSASGWCERAELLISDRLDGVLAPPGPARLEAHLRNCDRCVEHDRRLAQARDKLVGEFIDAHPHAEVERPAPLRAAPFQPQMPRPALAIVPDPEVVGPPPVEREVAPAQPPIQDAAHTSSVEPLLWRGLYGVAVLFAILTVLITVAAIAGVDRIV